MAFSLLVLLLSLPNLSTSDPRISKAALICGTTKSSDGGSFIHNFVSDMESLSDLVSTQRFASHVSGNSTSSPVFGLAQCFSDLSLTDCLLCFAECRTKLPRCLPSSSARIFLDGCFLRYDSIPFFSDSVSPLDSAVCGPLSNSTPPFNAVLTSVNDPFRASVLGVIENVSSQAVKKGGFGSGVWPADGSGSAVNGTGGFPAVYALAQCWKTVSKKGCGMCLDKARAEVRRCLPAKEGRALNAGCYLRYSSEKFYNELEVEERVSDSGSTKPFTVLAIASSIVIMVFLMFLGAFLGYKRLSKGRKDRKHLIRLPTAFRKSSLNFKYVVLEKATDFFNQSRKLGEGGAGSVYKGVLPDGRVIAVKRLFFNTRQWVDEFFNEVNLISGMQHKNLVKLLGCSIEGPESLLVYEYMPNKSLDCFLFDKNKNQLLSWQKRLDIIVGTAEGLAYLHEGSKFRIIHRDIKTSNILLDESLTAKIADFGLARCFSADKTHLSTGIAGTLGYMAPEYLVRGQLTEKADVYSFGILVLEIVCGRKNSIYSQESDSILQTVWKNYKENTLPDSVDECLRNNFPAKEVSGVLQVGLLCTQASAALRPSMAEVVKMLTEKDCPIPLPMQPPFLNASVVDPDITTTPTKSSSILSLASPTDNPLTISISEPR